MAARPKAMLEVTM